LKALAKALTPEKSMMSHVLQTLSVVQSETGLITGKTAVLAATNVLLKLTEAIVPDVLEFITTLCRTTKGIPELIGAIINILLRVLEQGKPKTVAPALETVSRFLYIFGTCRPPICLKA
jgi:hypothetical protein